MKIKVINRKVVRLGGFILVLVLLLTSVNIGRAQWLGDEGISGRIDSEDSPPLPDISTYDGTAEFTFEQLGHDTFELNSPSTRQFSQDFPYRWAIIGGITNSYIDIHFDLVDLDAGQPYVSERDLYLPTLEVQVNGVFAGAFVPQPGIDQVVRVPIPVAAVLGVDSNTHRFRFLYYRGVDCIGDASSKLLIYDDSTISLSYLTAPAVLNLADFPRPLVQESFIPETLQMIIPDDYSEHDLTVAALVAASIGNRAFGNLTVNLLKASDATFERLSISSAVIIGRPDTNAFLAQLYSGSGALTDLQRLPTQLSPAGSAIVGTEGQTIQPEDGVLQLVRSSVNPEHSYLIVTGVNDEAVMRAAQALSGVRPSIPLNNRLAVIKEYQEDAPLAEAEEEGLITLGELGFRDTTFYGVGAQSVTVSFFVPHNWRIQEGVALHLAYIHSSQLSHGYSSLTVSLNGDPIGSAPINTDMVGEQMVVIAIQPEDIRLGEFFSNPFFYLLSERGISNILVSLPPEPDQAVLNGMIRFAHLLGEEMRKPYFNFVVSMDADLSPEDYQDYHVVAFGQPTTNPLVMQVNDKMPQPFLEGGDVLGQDVGNVVYRLPTDFSMGVIEVFPSPWNSANGVTVVSGTTPEGFSWAMDTYSDKKLVEPEVEEAAIGELPERYQPQEEEPPISAILVYAVVIVGVVLAVAGTMKTILDRRKS
jgi:hypothetical protein